MKRILLSLLLLPSVAFASPGQKVTTSITSAATNNATVVKAVNATIYSYSISNTTATIKYVKFYNKATAPTCGTDVPVWRVAVPALSTVPFIGEIPLSTGLGYCIVTGATDADNTAVAASDVYLNISYY